jgi:hypothetical protein
LRSFVWYKCFNEGFDEAMFNGKEVGENVLDIGGRSG